MIDAALVEQIAACYSVSRHDPVVLTLLREAFPGVRFTHCNDGEICRAKPVVECDGFNLYLVGGEHCLSLTINFDNAKGVVIADMEDDE